MSDWRGLHGDQNLRMANKMLEQQGEINELKAEVERLKVELAKVTEERDQARASLDDVCTYCGGLEGEHTQRDCPGARARLCVPCQVLISARDRDAHVMTPEHVERAEAFRRSNWGIGPAAVDARVADSPRETEREAAQ